MLEEKKFLKVPTHSPELAMKVRRNGESRLLLAADVSRVCQLTKNAVGTVFLALRSFLARCRCLEGPQWKIPKAVDKISGSDQGRRLSRDSRPASFILFRLTALDGNISYFQSARRI